MAMRHGPNNVKILKYNSYVSYQMRSTIMNFFYDS